MKKLWIHAIYGVMFGCFVARGAEVSSEHMDYHGLAIKLSEDQAISLGNIALGLVDDRGFLDGGFGNDPPFYGFFAYRAHGNGHFAEVAVNPWTGDVWDSWHCKKMDKPELRAAQKVLKKINFPQVDEDLYKYLANMRPECFMDD
ncbi:MAG: hypothetical protein PW843_03250 [Azospirillaceae bacterium]|nr:hypothetical protein [Azospirillaceae bacterium]